MKEYIVKGSLFLATFSFAILSINLLFFKPKNDPIIVQPGANDLLPMPLVLDTDPQTASFKTAPPQPQRGHEFVRFLSATVKVEVSRAIGSGTIIYYDYDSGYAYVATCGHLWSGTRSAEQLKRRPIDCKVQVWYHNEEKITSGKTGRRYPAEVLFYSNNRGYDSALLKFKPDWEPNYFPIAPLDYEIKQGDRFHSMGCDHNTETAHYDVQFVGRRGADLVTRHNSPRAGRSGGGLLTDDGYYIATCWGTSDYSGQGVGYFTQLDAIYSLYKSNDFEWLLGISPTGMARRIPISDWLNPDRAFPEDFVPLPGRNKTPIFRSKLENALHQ